MTHWLLIVLNAAFGVAAVGAGQAFVRDPSGAALGMTTEWLAGSPFSDFRVPGLFLTLVIGRANLLSLVLLWRRHRAAPLASLGTGLLWWPGSRFRPRSSAFGTGARASGG